MTIIVRTVVWLVTGIVGTALMIACFLLSTLTLFGVLYAIGRLTHLMGG